jgi:hypothetical protein
LFGLDGGSNGVAEVYLGDFFLGMRKEGAELALPFDFSQLFHIFHVLLIGFGIPKHYTELHSVCLLVSKNQSTIGKVTPFVVRPNCRAVNA